MRNSLSQNVVIGPKKLVLKIHCLPVLRSRLGFIKIITIDIKSVDIFFSLKIIVSSEFIIVIACQI